MRWYASTLGHASSCVRGMLSVRGTRWMQCTPQMCCRDYLATASAQASCRHETERIHNARSRREVRTANSLRGSSRACVESPQAVRSPALPLPSCVQRQYKLMLRRHVTDAEKRAQALETAKARATPLVRTPCVPCGGAHGSYVTDGALVLSVTSMCDRWGAGVVGYVYV